MAQARSRQDYGRQSGIADMDRDAGLDERGITGFEQQRRIQAGAQIQPGRAIGGMRRQRPSGANAGIEDAAGDFTHG